MAIENKSYVRHQRDDRNKTSMSAAVCVSQTALAFLVVYKWLIVWFNVSEGTNEIELHVYFSTLYCTICDDELGILTQISEWIEINRLWDTNDGE